MSHTSTATENGDGDGHEEHVDDPALSTQLNSMLATQTHGHVDPSQVAVAVVHPKDPRMKYDPPNYWKDGTSCSNQTVVTKEAGATVTFVFHGVSSIGDNCLEWLRIFGQGETVLST